jgi:uncharacterized protein (TIGR03435 family)
MTFTKSAALAISCAVVAAHGFAQSPSSASSAELRFDVVSIKPNTSNAPGADRQPPQGSGLNLVNVPAIALLNQAFAPIPPAQMIGLPGWTSSERWNVRATSSLGAPTPEQRSAMVRAMLADRFKLVAHTEQREQPVYELMAARSDGRLGPGLAKSDLDCGRILAERAANPPRPATPDYTAPPPPCTFRIVDAPLRDRLGDRHGELGALLEGDGTLDTLANVLRLGVDHPVVNRAGLSGSYAVKMNFRFTPGGRGLLPATADAPDPLPSIFTAMPEQLGLKLQPGRAPQNVVVVEHIERPTED